MTRRHLSPLLGLGLLSIGMWAGALSPSSAATPDAVASMPIQVAGAGVGRETSLTAPASAPKLGLSGVFQPAPMPDQDVDPPSGGTARGASLTPALFSHKEEFAGDGFAAASDADHGLDHRRAPAAGLNWSVPVK